MSFLKCISDIFNPLPTQTELPPAPDKGALAFEAYKLEYEQAAARYENIYKAVWQNFSYMALVSGALLTFGKETIGLVISGFLACLPLIFWYWSTYEPLNRYGEGVLQTLKRCEANINEQAGIPLYRQLDHYTSFADGKASEPLSAKKSSVTRRIFIAAIGEIALAYLFKKSVNTQLGSTLTGLLMLAIGIYFFVVLLVSFQREDKHISAHANIRGGMACLHAIALTLLLGFLFQSLGIAVTLPNAIKPASPEKTTLNVNIQGISSLVDRQNQMKNQLDNTSQQLKQMQQALEDIKQQTR